jgi:serine-type D-Ala-D-Ala endopeptidase (penicillin-binding protein 7)
MKKITIITLLFCAFIIFFGQTIRAEKELDLETITDTTIFQEEASRNMDIFLDAKTILRGYTVSTKDDHLKLSLVPGILSESTRVLIEEIPDYYMELPWNLEKESSIMQFEFKNKQAYDDHKPFYIQLSYDNIESDYHKQVFFYDGGHKMWRPLPTRDFPKEGFVRSLIHLPFARIAVFSYPEILSVGKASWYKFRGGDFTASTDFPRGSILRVHNLDNKKYVDVVVNDYGPDRGIYPDRILDLDYEAFKKIADRGEGIINIFVEPLKIVPDDFGRRVGIGTGVMSSPEITSGAAILIKEDTGEVMLEKNADEVMPIASLTKIFSVFSFLNHENNNDRLEEIVEYKLQDENYNHQYFNRWQIARINFNEGDRFSVKDAIYSSLVRSANNSVETLVRVSGLDRNEFIKKVNLWAEEKGAKNFHINEPTGLDIKNIASARDLAILSQHAFNNSVIRDASTSKRHSFVTRNDNSLKLRYNSSDLVLNNNYKYFNIIGSKTGYLKDAGYCLITRAEINGENYLVVTLNSSSRAESFKETIDFLNYAAYRLKKIII